MPKRKIVIDRVYLEYRYLVLLQSAQEIAREYGCSKPTILSALRKYQIPVRSCKAAHITFAYINKMGKIIPEGILRKRYIEEQLTMSEISVLFNCSKSCVRKNLIPVSYTHLTLPTTPYV